MHITAFGFPEQNIFKNPQISGFFTKYSEEKFSKRLDGQRDMYYNI